MPLTVTYRRSEGHEYLTTQVLKAKIFKLAGLADIDLKEHHLFPAYDTNKQPGADSLETMIRDNTKRRSGKMVSRGTASVNGVHQC